MKIRTTRFDALAFANGLVHFSANGVVLSDRGGLHEVLDLTVVPGDTNEKKDGHREVHHFLAGLHDDADIEGNVITGEARTRDGRGDTMWYETILETDTDPRFLRLTVRRKYLRDMKFSGDNSICFLSPGGFAARYGVGATEPDYIGYRSDGDQWANEESPSSMSTSPIPRRLRVGFADHGWGSIVNEDGVGFGLIVLEHSSTDPGYSHGEIRVTRPRPPAEHKFDEIELQWMPGGKRVAGSIETAVLLLFPCDSAEDANQIYSEMLRGGA